MTNEVTEYTSKAGTEIHAVFDTVKFGDLHMVKYATQRDVANIHVMGRVDAVGTAKGKRQTNGACVFTIFQKDRLIEAVKGTKEIFLTNHELLNYGDGSTTVGTQDKGRLLQLGSRRNNTANPDVAANGGLTNLTNTSIFSIDTYGQTATAVLADQIPPFDITLVGISEVDPNSANRMVIHGVQFTSDQGGTSIDDLVLERQLTFIARRISPWRPLSEVNNAGKVAGSPTSNANRLSV
jgi:hypothetical protein